MRLLGCLLLLGLSLGAVPRPAGATPLIYDYTGSILGIGEELAAESLPFGVNDPVRLTVTIDDGATSTPLSSGGTNYFPIDSYSLTLNESYQVDGDSLSSVSQVIVVDGTTDAFQARTQALPSASLPADFGIWRFAQIIAGLNDSSGSAFSSEVLPTSLDLDDFSFTELTVIFRNPDDQVMQQSVFATVTSVSVSVPEPGLALLGAVALAVGLSRTATRGDRSSARAEG
jgi:hypothetical protein